MQRSSPPSVSDKATVQRRAFLGATATAGIAAGMGCLTMLTGKELTAADFDAQRGSRFQVYSEDSEPLSVELVEAIAFPPDPERPSHVRSEPFTLIFRAAPGARFHDQICKIWHPQMGTIETFLSPVDMPKNGLNLQAVFA